MLATVIRRFQSFVIRVIAGREETLEAKLEERLREVDTLIEKLQQQYESPPVFNVGSLQTSFEQLSEQLKNLVNERENFIDHLKNYNRDVSDDKSLLENFQLATKRYGQKP